MESVGSVLSCRLMLQLRAYAHRGDSGGEFTSMSVNPAPMGRPDFRDRKISGRRTSQSHTEWDESESTKEEHELPTRLPKFDAPV